MDVIKTDVGYISGTVLGEPDKPVHVYRGIPYAAPPMGALRWRPPQPVTPWKGIRECTAFSAAAPQPATAVGKFVDGVPESEDCLYLNVISPAKKDDDKLPVMVWMHGGGLLMGTGNGTLTNGLALPLHGVVLVNINMRLGPLGCLAHRLLSQESPNGVSGNYLFLDILAALKWVQTNISAFGGNPDNVTIFGQSGGAVKVMNLMASPMANGLFHKAIAQSGSRPGTYQADMERALGERFFAELGVDKETDPLDAARAIPWKKIIEVGQRVSAEASAELKLKFGPWNSVVDGWFLLDTPDNIFEEGLQNCAPLIVGATMGETNGTGGIVAPEWISDYVTLLNGSCKVGENAYAYVFDHVPAGWRNALTGAVHSMEVPYVFGDLNYRSGADWAATIFIAKQAGAKSPDPGLTDVDRQVSETMMKMWANFAKTGNPSLKGVVKWPAWNEKSDQYLYITEKLEVKSGFSKVAQK